MTPTPTAPFSAPPDFRSGAVALLGPPNAGKSTLLNTLVGQKVAIVTPKPQTTRNRISGIVTTNDMQVLLLDTPGIHAARGALNKFIVRQAWESLSMADAVVLLLDSRKYADNPAALDKDLAVFGRNLGRGGQPLLLALNKVDLVTDKRRLLPLVADLAQRFGDHEVTMLSAATGEGTERLLMRLRDLLPCGPPLFDPEQVSTLSLRFMAAEAVREKLFLNLREELPYSVAVEIENWEEDEKRARVNAVIYVSRASHKGMVIGKGGALLKKVGAEARADIEEMLGKPLFLELWVKVQPGWQDDPRFVLGLGPGEMG